MISLTTDVLQEIVSLLWLSFLSEPDRWSFFRSSVLVNHHWQTIFLANYFKSPYFSHPYDYRHYLATVKAYSHIFPDARGLCISLMYTYQCVSESVYRMHRPLLLYSQYYNWELDNEFPPAEYPNLRNLSIEIINSLLVKGVSRNWLWLPHHLPPGIDTLNLFFAFDNYQPMNYPMTAYVGFYLNEQEEMARSKGYHNCNIIRKIAVWGIEGEEYLISHFARIFRSLQTFESEGKGLNPDLRISCGLLMDQRLQSWDTERQTNYKMMLRFDLITNLVQTFGFARGVMEFVSTNAGEIMGYMELPYGDDSDSLQIRKTFNLMLKYFSLLTYGKELVKALNRV